MKPSAASSAVKKRARTNRKNHVTLSKESLDSRLFVYERSKSKTIWGCIYRLDFEGLYKKLKSMRKEDRETFFNSSEETTGLSPTEVASQGFCAGVVRAECNSDLCNAFAATIGTLSSSLTDELIDFTKQLP